MTNEEKVNQLLEKLEILQLMQNRFSNEIKDLREQLQSLKSIPSQNLILEVEEVNPPPQASIPDPIISGTPVQETTPEEVKQPTNEKFFDTSTTVTVTPKEKSNIEKFIGENLINKIGIAITVIGVAIGAKYSIDNQLISPLTRIILGYFIGLGLLGFAIKLKKNYQNYSAVLVSGAIAILYFITYAAFSFYELIPQGFAFALMVLFTSFTVIAALNYNKQVIAHLGLVGAYAVPFLLSDGSGKVEVLFGYMAIINSGILVIAFKKYWKPLYYSAFFLTWLIFFTWFVSDYQETEHFVTALLFSAIFFVIFYTLFLGYKLLQKEIFNGGDVLLLLANSFIFYGLGYLTLNQHESGSQFLGLFTLGNALVHFGICVLIYKHKLADKNLFFLVAGLVLVFITIAVPVQLDGNWVTLVWAFEAALLFWIGRTKAIPIYERLSYPLMFLAFFSIVHDWTTSYNYFIPGQPETKLIPFANINFLSALFFIGSFAFINFLNTNSKYASQILKKGIKNLLNLAIPGILLLVLYFAFRIEIATYWNQLYMDSAITLPSQGDLYSGDMWNSDLLKFESIWLLNYSLLFFALLALVNIKKLKSRKLGLVNIGFSLFVLFIFITEGLYVLSDLRESYLNQTLAEYYDTDSFNIGIRYVSFVFVALSLASISVYLKKEFMQPLSPAIHTGFELLLYTVILWILSSELITWMDILQSSSSYKLGLSILWGVYALFLIGLGIWKKKKHFRIGAIILFSITLLKLFFYDIAAMDTISKTIVFVSLGILLLIISFLYNKFKHLIAAGNEN